MCLSQTWIVLFILNSIFKALILFRHRRQQTKITKHDLSEYRAACTRLNERYGLSREIFTKAYSEMILIPIFDINLDARGINIYSKAVWLFYRWLQEGEREFLSSAEPMARTAPSWEPSSWFSSYLTRIIYVNATKSLTILPVFSTACGSKEI